MAAEDTEGRLMRPSLLSEHGERLPSTTRRRAERKGGAAKEGALPYCISSRFFSFHCFNFTFYKHFDGTVCFGPHE